MVRRVSFETKAHTDANTKQSSQNNVGIVVNVARIVPFITILTSRTRRKELKE